MEKRFQESAIRIAERVAHKRMNEDQKKLFIEKISNNPKIKPELLDEIEKSFKRSRKETQTSDASVQALDEIKKVIPGIFG